MNEEFPEPCDFTEESKGVVKFTSTGVEIDKYFRWYTPQEYVDCARLLMGDIDIDPATDERIQKRIRAKVYHTDTPEKDAFKFEWKGRMLLCPPYKEGLIDRFINKAIDEYKKGNVTEGVIITHTMDTGAEYFQNILASCSACCFHRGNIKWWAGHWVEDKVLKNWGMPGISGTYSVHSNCILYLGNNPMGFKLIFGKFGTAFVAVP
jgi:hypothetical protein